MLTSKSFNKLTRRGKLLKVLREHYLRDDISCGASGCAACEGADAAAGAVVTAASAGSATLTQTWLSPEPRDMVVVIPDTNIMLHQMDVLEAAGAAITDVVILQTVLGETRHRHMGTYSRLLTLLRDTTRRFVPFGNEHHSETYSERLAGETANDYSDRLVRKAAAWLAQHYEPLGLRVLLLTDDADNGRRAREEEGLSVATMRQYVKTVASAAAAAAASSSGDGSGGLAGPSILSRLADLVASRDDDETGTVVSGAGGASTIAGEASAVASSSSSSSSASASVSGASAPGARRRKVNGPQSGSLYREHWAPSRIAGALKTRGAFQGTLRVNRECWFEARVAVHGLLAGRARSEGERLALGGGEDVVSVLISGREAINRAMEGDSVVIQLLPRSQWRSPSSKLAERDASAPQGGAAAAEEEEGSAEPGAEEGAEDAAAVTDGGEVVVGADGSSSAAGTGTLSDLRHAMQEAAITTTATATTAWAGDDAAASGELVGGDVDEFPRDEGHDTAVEDLRRAMSKAAATVVSAKAASGPSALSGLPGGVVPTGRVVGIVKRAWRHYCGSLEPEEESGASSVVVVSGGGDSSTSSALFVPVDPKIPRIRIDTRQKGSLMDKRMVVAVDGWAPHDRYPRGHYVRTIGPIGDRAAETEVILLEHDIPFRPFSADVLACLPPADWSITPDNSRGRIDLRGIPVCSVDPPGCKDIDDALHARWVTDPSTGLPAVEVGVHIADVSYFVRPGTAIDIEAASRSNTTYLVERRLDMLPGLLTETLCSLKGGVDRFAFSVTWLFRPSHVSKGGDGTGEWPTALEGGEGAEPGPAGRDLSGGLPSDGKGVLSCGWEVVPGSVKYFKSIIHSHAAMTYGMAQALLDEEATPNPVAGGIKLLASIARSLKAGRKAAGALTLGSAEVRFQLDSETHDPIDVSAYDLKETNSMVEEFMLLANVWTAKRTAETFPRYAMLRRHPAPPRSQFDSLLAAASAVGVEMKVDSGLDLANSLDAAVVAGNPYFNKLLRILATRCMMQAVYFPSGEVSVPEYAHYGLAAPMYTHFTSPIRRYADVIVHRLLASALEIDPLPSDYEDLSGMRRLCDNMNRRHLMSQLAGRASGSLHTNLFFKSRVVVESGLIMRVRANGVALLVPRFGLEGVVILGKPATEGAAATGALALLKRQTAAKAGGEDERILTYDEAGQLVADATDPERLRIRIFDEVRVALCVEAHPRFPYRKELVLRIVDPPFHALPSIPGYAIEDATAGKALVNSAALASAASAGAGAAGGGGAAAVAPAAAAGAEAPKPKAKKQPRPEGSGPASEPPSSPTAVPPSAKKAKTAATATK